MVKDREVLLDITGLGHGNDTSVITNVQDAILLEDGAEHVLNNDRRSRVGDERRLFLELLSEEVNTKVAVLAGLGRGGDADDLARTTLEDQEVTNTNVVARHRDGVWRSAGTANTRSRHGELTILDRNVLSAVVVSRTVVGSRTVVMNGVVLDQSAFLVLVVLVVLGSVNGMENTVGSAVQSVTK